MHRGREDEYGKTLCVLLQYVCILYIVTVSFPLFFCREGGGVAGVINFCTRECCTGWIYVGNFALIPSKLYFDTFYKCCFVYQKPVFCP